jgi:hypothetical protein
MKILLATTAMAAAMAFSPAFAQEADQQAAPAPKAADGSVLVEGLKPSKVLGAIDTSKLVDENATDQTAESSPPLSIPEKTTSITTIETPPENARPLVNIASVNVPLPQEVAQVAQNGKYTTQDLVKAQLMAMNNAPPIQQPVVTTTTITYPDDNATPAPSTAGQADQARRAESSTGNAGDLTPSDSSASPG